MSCSLKHAAKVLAALPGTQAQVRHRTGMADCMVREMLKAMHKAGECHIGHFQYTSIRPTRVYYSGPGQDAVSSPPVRQAARSAPRQPVRRDPLVAALFGEVEPC